MKRWTVIVLVVLLAGVLAIVLLDGAGSGGASDPSDSAPRRDEEEPRAPELRGAPPPERASGLPEKVEAPVEAPVETPEEAPAEAVAPLEGVVFDAETGAGIAGAVLTLTKGGSTKTWSEASIGGPIGRARSDATGRFRFASSPREGLLTVEALAPGYARLARTLEPFTARGPRRVELRMSRAGRLEGKVQRPDGSPAAGAVVYVLAADAPEMLRANPDHTAFGGGKTWTALRATAEDDGSYLVDGLDLDAAHVAAAIGKEGTRSPWAEDIVPTAAAPWVRRDLALEAPGSLRVRVLGPGEARVEGARVLIFGPGRLIELAPADQEPGAYAADGIFPDAYTLRVDAEGLLRKEQPVTVAEGPTAVVVRLAAGAVVSGVLVDDTGAPIANQKVFVSTPWWKAGEWPESDGRTTTDEEGRFRIEGLYPKPHCFHLVLGKHYVPEFQFVEPPVEDIEFEVLRMAALRARLVLPPGVGAPAIVDAGIRHATREGWPEGQEGWKSVGRRVDWNDGSIFIEAIPPLACRLRIQVAGCAPWTRQIRFRPGEVVDLGDVRLLRGLALPILVHDTDGNPIEGADVWVEAEHRSSPTTTDADGRCVLRSLAGGTHELEVEAEGFVSRTLSVDLPLAQAELAIRLTRGALVTCRVETRRGTPAAGATLRWVRADEATGEEPDWEYDQTDHRGEVAIRVAPGRWLIEVLDEDGNPITGREVSANAGSGTECRLLLAE